jgi:hypothetical protein
MRFLSFEKPMAEVLTRVLYYLAIAGVLWRMVKEMWRWINYIDNDWDTALWWLIKTPVMALVAILVLRVIAEYVLAHFRIDRSLHDQVTGRAVPPGSR